MYCSEVTRRAGWWGTRAGARLGANTEEPSRLPEQKSDTMLICIAGSEVGTCTQNKGSYL